MMTPAAEQIVARETEHQRIRARVANLKQPRRLQLILAVGDRPAWLTDMSGEADAEWNGIVEA